MAFTAQHFTSDQVALIWTALITASEAIELSIAADEDITPKHRTHQLTEAACMSDLASRILSGQK